MMKKIMIVVLGLVTGLTFASKADKNSENDLASYCKANDGTAETMQVEFAGTSGGMSKGFSKEFCTFEIDNGFIAVGLETFSSQSQNIAATFIKTLEPLDESSSLWEGSYSNPSLNVCKNLGGSEVVFNVGSGGFANEKGESDICVFGDGSMVSAWSLIYMANGRDGYDKVKNAVKSKPLNINIPGSKP